MKVNRHRLFVSMIPLILSSAMQISPVNLISRGQSSRVRLTWGQSTCARVFFSHFTYMRQPIEASLNISLAATCCSRVSSDWVENPIALELFAPALERPVDCVWHSKAFAQSNSDKGKALNELAMVARAYRLGDPKRESAHGIISLS